MGYRSSRTYRDDSQSSEDSESQDRRRGQPGQRSSSDSERSPGPDTPGLPSWEEAEAYYDREIDDHKEYHALKRLEKRYGETFDQWIEEGVPVEAMGSSEKIEAYRTWKGTPVPWDIDRDNQKSKDRNVADDDEAADGHRGPAGKTGVPEVVRNVVSSPGQSLDESVQRTVEDRMGESLGDVRIHAGPRAAEAAEAIDARAFTVGNHIAFNHGEYDPDSAEGQHVLVHELAHVRQQTGGALSMLPQEDVALEVDPDPALEREAEETAQRVMSGGELGIQRLQHTEVHVQRDRQGTLHDFTDTDREYPPHPVKNDDARFGHAQRKNYRKTYFEKYPSLEGRVVVHHAVEQRYLKTKDNNYQNIVSPEEMHSLENLRGIPEEKNPSLHLRKIENMWTAFRAHNDNPTKEELLEKATEVDDKFGGQFLPPVRE